MTTFEYSNYRKALGNLLSAKKDLMGSNWSMAKLAKEARIQPSYLTNVIKERAHLSADQLYAIAEGLGLKSEETEYLQTLMEWERAAHEGRKKKLSETLASFRKQNLKTDRYISAQKMSLSKEDQERYYLDPYIELIHLYLTTRGCPRDLKKIAGIWQISEERLGEIFAFLERINVIEKKGQWWSVRDVSQHLPTDSPLCRPRQLLKKMRGIDAIQRARENRAYSFGATVTMNEQTRLQIHSRFLEFVKECEALVKGSTPENLFEIQFDLFSWTE